MTEKSRVKPYDQRLAHLAVAPLKNLPLHPNYFTLLTLLLGQAAAWLFALAVSEYGWLAALCYMLAVFSDHLDGEYARMTGKTSSFGHNFDYIVGGINYTCLFIGIGIGLAESYGHWALLLGLAAGLCNPFILYMRMYMEQKHGPDVVEHPAFAAFELEDFIYLIGPITWLAGILWFFVPYALGNIGYLVWTITEFTSLRKKNQTGD
ncbi:MAG TPA: CDP-alcohol phosphatidyltransferase family protein [Gammaproteobacteria bacterium]|nr:CDP-alcohol phosphatidyltransferase family protein [Gammaproteobacteria bacterium]